jgi:hypothetical protein
MIRFSSFRSKNTFSIAVLILAGIFLPQVMLTAQGRLSPEERALIGVWKNSGGYSYIDTTFEFRPDGTYFYDAGRVSAWRVSHEGTYSIRPSRLRPMDRILVLTPTRILKEPPREGQIALEVNRRMDNTPREFKISDSRWGFKVPTKTLQDLDRDPNGAMQWWISRDIRP